MEFPTIIPPIGIPLRLGIGFMGPATGGLRTTTSGIPAGTNGAASGPSRGGGVAPPIRPKS